MRIRAFLNSLARTAGALAGNLVAHHGCVSACPHDAGEGAGGPSLAHATALLNERVRAT